jgi:hypothetical protein
MIKSPAFRKKSERDIPKINNKTIPLHYTYGLRDNWSFMKQLEELDCWADIGLSFTTPRKKISPKSEPKRRTYSPSEHLFKEYMKRRPSLILTRRHDDQIDEMFTERSLATPILLKPQSALESPIRRIRSDNHSKLNRTTPSKSRLSKITSTTGTHTAAEEEIPDFRNILIIRMSQKDLGQYNDHNFRVNSILERRKRRS